MSAEDNNDEPLKGVSNVVDEDLVEQPEDNRGKNIKSKNQSNIRANSNTSKTYCRNKDTTQQSENINWSR
jgi:hypothetical protein